MKLIIDGNIITPKPDQSLLDMVKELGLIKGKLSTDPIAAKISGEVFNLNYVPLRQKDVQPERATMRKAMESSDGIVRLIHFDDPTGYDTYTRTVQFVLFLAIDKLWPGAHATMNCTLGSGLYIRVNDVENFSYIKLKNKVSELIKEDIL